MEAPLTPIDGLKNAKQTDAPFSCVWDSLVLGSTSQQNMPEDSAALEGCIAAARAEALELETAETLPHEQLGAARRASGPGDGRGGRQLGAVL